jgi:hypothetical protein
VLGYGLFLHYISVFRVSLLITNSRLICMSFNACRDLFSVPNLISVNATLQTHKSLVTKAYMIVNPDDLEALAHYEEEAEWIKDYIDPGRFFATIRQLQDCTYLTDSSHLSLQRFLQAKNQWNPSRTSSTLFWRAA